MAVQLTLPALKALIPNLLKTGGTAAATNAILSSLFGQGGAVRSPVPTAAAGKYTLPQ